MANELVVNLRARGVQLLPDSDRYKCRFTVRSESSNRLYMISFDVANGAGYWKCSCPGYLRTGQCKHLTAMGLKGRKYGKDNKTLQILMERA